MTAPFLLPDSVSIFDDAGTLLFADVDARVVPAWAKGFMAVASGTTAGGRWFGWTHWVDVDPVGFIPDGGVFFDDFRQDEEGPFPTIEFGYAEDFLVLNILWTERRFTNTDAEYIRCYCARQQRYSI